MTRLSQSSNRLSRRLDKLQKNEEQQKTSPKQRENPRHRPFSELYVTQLCEGNTAILSSFRTDFYDSIIVTC